MENEKDLIKLSNEIREYVKNFSDIEVRRFFNALVTYLAENKNINKNHIKDLTVLRDAVQKYYRKTYGSDGIEVWELS